MGDFISNPRGAGLPATHEVTLPAGLQISQCPSGCFWPCASKDKRSHGLSCQVLDPSHGNCTQLKGLCHSPACKSSPCRRIKSAEEPLCAPRVELSPVLFRQRGQGTISRLHCSERSWPAGPEHWHQEHSCTFLRLHSTEVCSI